MICDTKRMSTFIAILALILTLSHLTVGGGSWKRLERMFIQDHHSGEHWDENRIVFPDMTDDPTKSSWRSTTPGHYNPKRPCQANCPVSREYSPVCGTNGVTYQNMGQLQCDIKCGVAVDLHRPSPCSSNTPTIITTLAPTTTTTPAVATTQRNIEMEDCIRRCPSTPEYNPVCGTNFVTYSNAGKLQCAQICGVDVNLWRHSPCPAFRASTSTVAPTTTHHQDGVSQECISNCPTTSEYNPICGTDSVTYNNIGKLECAKLCGAEVNVQNHGRCSVSSTEQVSDNFGSTSEEDYGEENIDPRYRPRNQRFYWK